MKITADMLDPFPIDRGPLEKTRHLFRENSRVTVIDGPHTGRSGKLLAINAHGGHVVRLDDGGHEVEYTHQELSPEGFHSGHDSREKRSAFGSAGRVDGLMRALETDRVTVHDRVQIQSLLEKLRTGRYPMNPFPLDDDQPDYNDPRHTLKVFAEKYADGAPPAASDVLAKRARSIDRSKLHLGMRVKGFAGKVGKIVRIRDGAVDIEYDEGGSGTSLIDYIEEAA